MSTSAALYRRLLNTLRPYRSIVAIAFVAMAVQAATEPLLPALMRPLIDDGMIGKNAQSLALVPLYVLLLYTVRGLAEYTAAYCNQWAAGKVIADLRVAMFDHMVRLPLLRQLEIGSGPLVSKASFDVLQISTALTQAWIVLVKDGLVVVGLLAFLLWTSWQLTAVVFLIGPVAAWAIGRAGRAMRSGSRDVQAHMGKMNHVIEESLGARREIAVYDGYARERGRFAHVAERIRAETMAIVRASAGNVPVVQVLAALAVSGVLLVATRLSASDLMTPGQLVAFITAMALLFDPIRRLTAVNETLQRGLAAAHSIFSLLDEPAEPDGGTRSLDRASGALRLDGLTFTYPGAEMPALKHIDLDIAAGETVAFVGASGSGKTTLLNLLCRFHPVSGPGCSGRILLDDMDIAELTLTTLRKQLGVVGQTTVLFDDTVAANIAYGAVAPDAARIAEAARRAHASGFIDALPQGMATPVGADGARLSGGQRQRLALARAFYKDAPVVLLDEATSALDAGSERLVQDAILGLQGRRTLLIVAHRIHTVRHADRIVVLEAGRVVELGTHEQLMALQGHYWQLALQPQGVDALSEPLMR